MKKSGGVIGLIAAIALFAAAFIPAPKAGAAACESIENYGAVRLFLPEVSNKKDYNLWVRLQSDDQQAKVLIERNQTDCFEIFGATPDANQWYWQSYQVSGSTARLRFSKEQGNVLLIIGVQSGVRVDKILLTEPDCVPQEFGNNCKDALEAISLNDSTVINLPPPSNDPVSGNVTLSLTPTSLQKELKQVSYVVGGRTIQRFNSAEPFDTTLLENGKHTINIDTELQDGTKIREATVIEIENPQNVLSPVIRWIRLNISSLKLTGMVVAGIIILLLLISGVRHWYLKRRELKFHGF